MSLVFGKSEAQIRAEMDARANVGLATDDSDWVDTRSPGLYYTATQGFVIMLAAAYDRMNEAVNAAIPTRSWGEHLDAHAEGYSIERKVATYAEGEETFTGNGGSLIPSGTTIGVVQTDADVEPPMFVTLTSGTISGDPEDTNTLTLPIRAVEPGTDGNVGAGQITFLDSAVDGIDSLTNATATSGGEEVETDEALIVRIKAAFAGKGSGTAGNYAQWAINWPSVGRVRVIPIWQGPDTVQLIVSSADGSPLAGSVVDALQADLDPDPGKGSGRAPIGHVVTVQTPTGVNITVVATIALEPGHSLGSVSAAVEQALRDYIDTLLPGQNVIYNHVVAQFFRVEGVSNVSGPGTGGKPTVNGGIVDITITADPPRVARLQTVTLS